MDVSLRQIQRELSTLLMGSWFWWARDRYLRAARLCNVTNEMVQRLESPIPNLQRLTAAYALIASRYNERFPGLQLEFSFDGLSQEQIMAKKWCTFFLREAAAAVENDTMVLCILNACVPSGSDLGHNAESLFLDLVDSRFSRGIPELPVVGHWPLEEYVHAIVREQEWGRTPHSDEDDDVEE